MKTMSIPYSNDLRYKALKMIDDGMQQKEVTKLLSINRSTLFRWQKRRDLEGNCDFKGYSKNHDRRKIRNISNFVNFLEDNKTLSLSEMSDNFSIKVSQMTIYRLIKKLGYSYKKNSGYILNEMKEEERDITKI